MGMVTYKYVGGCHCGNIAFEVEFTGKPDSYNPRVCDCDFCRKHAASYVSDPQGSLLIHIKDERNLGKYRQGSGIADFLLCRNCGVLVGVTFQTDGRLYATVNSKSIDGGPHFGEETPVSPSMLSDSEKTERWKDIWFGNVSINTINA
jgi:hypothetical protein